MSDDWDTDPDYINDQTEKQQRYGSKTIHQPSVDMRELAEEVKQADRVNKLKTAPKPSFGYGGKFGVEKDRMDKSAVGWDHVEAMAKHASQKDHSTGFGGKFGVQTDRQDKSAVGWSHKTEVVPHPSQTDASQGFGGKFGVQEDRVDASATGWTLEGPSFQDRAKHTSQEKPEVPRSTGALASLRSKFEQGKSASATSSQGLTPGQLRVQQEQSTWAEARRNNQSAREPEPESTSPSHGLTPGQLRVQQEQSTWAEARRNNQSAREPEPESTSPSHGLTPGQLRVQQEQSTWAEARRHNQPVREPVPEPVPADVPHSVAPTMEQPPQLEQDQEDMQQPEPCEQNSEVLYTAIAAYDFPGEDDDELSFHVGDLVTEIRILDENWGFGTCNGQEGLFPLNHVTEQP